MAVVTWTNVMAEYIMVIINILLQIAFLISQDVIGALFPKILEKKTDKINLLKGNYLILFLYLSKNNTLFFEKDTFSELLIIFFDDFIII